MRSRNILSLFMMCLAIAKAQQSIEPPKPIIQSLHINSDIKYTYAKTFVSSKILNPAEVAQEVNFRVVLPEEAFITGLVMTIKGKSYNAYIKEKEEAKKEYNQAVSSGRGAAHVFQESRFSKDFTVSVNVEPQEKVNFNLTYEELLSRKNKTYQNTINVNPHQIVDNLTIVVNIEDALEIINVDVDEFSLSNNFESSDGGSFAADITRTSPTKVHVEWKPSTEDQIKLNREGLNGQMIVKYDVNVSNNPQQILVDSDGYFVHILRNDKLPVLNKHVVFVLDVSGSMGGNKIVQLKDAMKKILLDLSESDKFSIVLFSDKVVAWGPKEGANLNELNVWSDTEPANIIVKDDYVIPATQRNIESALEFIKSISTYGGTNILGGLRNGLKLAKKGQELNANSAQPMESMIIFLTDGQPNSEESDPDKITEKVKILNNGVTIFTLGFGRDADMKFLKKLSLANHGFARRIYEDSDASIQLQNFYKEVASPVLSNIKFEYLPDQVEDVTEGFKNLFLGSDVQVLGKVKPNGNVSGVVTAITRTGVQRIQIPGQCIIILPKEENKTLGYLEKMWAYKTIKSLLEKNTISKNESIECKAKELALKYSFVTPLTSLVVVKPNDSGVVSDEELSGQINRPYFGFASSSICKFSRPLACFASYSGPQASNFGGVCATPSALFGMSRKGGRTLKAGSGDSFLIPQSSLQTATAFNLAKALPKPIIQSLHVNADIKYTYAKTFVTSEIINPAEVSQEVDLRVVFPEEAFITGLVVSIKGKSCKAFIKEKEGTKSEYDQAVSSGQGAPQVFQEPYFAKTFTVSVNVEPQEKVKFDLTYEELLSRKNRTYQNTINVNPHQIVDNLSIVVNIEDALEVTNVEVDELGLSKDSEKDEAGRFSADITRTGPNKVRVEWKPSTEDQINLNREGLNGQMIVQYDVNVSNNPQQILVDSDGYFVHILRNDTLPALNKHVVFVLDVSGSMKGNKIAQLQDAMQKILLDLSQSDYFSILLFSVTVVAWGPKEGANIDELKDWFCSKETNIIVKDDYVIPATRSNIDSALEFIKTLSSYYGKNILGGLRNGMKLANKGQELNANSAQPMESMIIFLTDGQPNSEESDPDKIIEKVKILNNGVTIFTLGFGREADMAFLKKLSLANHGFARRIYEDSDVSIQLQNFYKEISSPVLSDIKFEYLPDQVEEVTSNGFKYLFSFSDILVLGKVKPNGNVAGVLTANSRTGIQRFQISNDDVINLPKEENKIPGYLEKMWAYKTIKSLLDKNTISRNDSIESKAKELALKYSFVTNHKNLFNGCEDFQF